jgi:DNA polymerase (family 10)
VQDAHQIARCLEDIAALLVLSGESRFKILAYERGVAIVENLGERLGPVISDGSLTELEGIGPGLAKQIAEMWNAGESSLLSELRARHPEGAAELLRVPGMTPRRVRLVQAALDVHSVDELRDACLQGRVRALAGFGPKTEAKLLAAIGRATQATEGPARIIIGDALRLAIRVAHAVASDGAAARVEPAGAVRRFDETAGEVELVVATEHEPRLWQELERVPGVVRIDEQARTALLAQGIALQLHVAAPERFGACLLFATGPETHLDALRQRARERGLTLSRTGLLTPAGGLMPESADEAAIYRALDMPFVPPELRATDSVAADSGYADLLEAADIRGMVHCHTTYSDGKNSIEEMAVAAQALGMQYITITDHSPSAHYARGVTLDRLKEQWEEIDRVQERVQIRILRGTESDILADGALDYPDAVIEQLDVVIASIHSRFQMDPVAMTARLRHALQLPLFKIWGHALGRLILSRDPIACDLLSVLDGLAGSRGAIEINGDPHRLDLPAQFIPLARERGIPFVISVDAHSTRGLDALPFGVHNARRGGIRRGEVLNTLAAEDFAARVRPIMSD